MSRHDAQQGCGRGLQGRIAGCELDQAAATLALEEHDYSAFLAKTHPLWFSAVVDRERGGTLSFPGYRASPKAHLWLNGYHVAEHALVSYITGALLTDKPFRLYFAPSADVDNFAPRPYYFDAPLERTAPTAGIVEARFRGRTIPNAPNQLK